MPEAMPMVKPRPFRRWAPVLAFAAFSIGLGAVLLWEEQRFRRELARARQDIGRREWEAARRRLEGLSRFRPPWRDSEIDYWLGLSEWNAGRRDAALEAFRRIPVGSRFDDRAALLQAEALVMRWEFRAAEDRLVQVLNSPRTGLNPVRDRLVRLVRMEARFDEVRGWLRESIAEVENPVSLLRQLWLIDRGVIPTAGLRENLEIALTKRPDDDRVWLGLGRVATLEGRFVEAEKWLHRCHELQPQDRIVERAWLDWAFATERADEVEKVLSGALDVAREPFERWAWRARLARLQGKRDDEKVALERWLTIEPRSVLALERLATVLAEGGQIGRAAELRNRKTRVDEALDRYQTRISGLGRFENGSDRLLMARLAEEAGRSFEARAWGWWAARAEPGNPEVVELLARLESTPVDRTPSETRPDLPPRDAPAVVPRNRSRLQAKLDFRDDAGPSGLRFTFQSGETANRPIPSAMGGGVGILDYDGDGWLDVYCVQGGPFPPGSTTRSPGDQLFHNRGNGTFEDVSESSGIAKFARAYGNGVAVGDYDGDGHPDLFLTRWRSYALYRNRGDGTFEDQTRASGFEGDRDWPTSAAFADLDGDGDLDLYVCHYLKWNADHPELCRDPQTQAYITCGPRQFSSMPDHVFRNDNGRFVDLSLDSGIAIQQGGGGLGVVASDLDGDGKIDLFVANDQSANQYYRNLGGFRFEESGHVAGLAASADGGYKAGMGIACGDLDGDGKPELAITNFYGESTTLYRNLGGGRFSDETSVSGLAGSSRYLLGFGASFLDVDNDGYLDLMTANGHLDPLPGTPYKMPVQLLIGDGVRFQDMTHRAGPALPTPRLGRALAVGDLDNDGRLDALVLDHDAPLAYLHNQSTGVGHFLEVKLEGSRSNRDAVGARVAVIVGGSSLHRERIGGGSYQSASDGRLHFGLGPVDRIEAIQVTWPSGLVERFEEIEVDRGYHLREGECQPARLPGFSRP